MSLIFCSIAKNLENVTINDIKVYIILPSPKVAKTVAQSNIYKVASKVTQTNNYSNT